MNDHTRNTPKNAQGRTQAPSEHATHDDTNDDAISFTELTAGAEVTIIINGAELKQVIRLRCGDIDCNLFDNGNPLRNPGGTFSMDFQNATIVSDSVTSTNHPDRPTQTAEGELLRDKIRREQHEQHRRMYEDSQNPYRGKPDGPWAQGYPWGEFDRGPYGFRW